MLDSMILFVVEKHNHQLVMLQCLQALMVLVKGGAALAAKALGLGATASRIARGARNWYNQGRNVRVPNENTASWSKHFQS